jgi:hypothetical protein
MRAQYYAELATRLRQAFEETKSVHGDKHESAIGLIRYQLLTGARLCKELGELIAEEERTQAASGAD